MKIEYSHNHTQKSAYKIIDKFLNKLEKEYGNMIQNPSKEWNDSHDKMNFNFKAKGFDLNGTITLYDSKIIVDGKLPFLASFFEGKIKSVIVEKLEEIL